MRRIDAIAIGLGVFATGGIAFLVLQWLGLDSLQAGIWSQVLLVGGLLGWLGSYLFRVGSKNMTYNQQLRDYQDAVLQKKLEEMSPEEITQLQGETDPTATSNSSS